VAEGKLPVCNLPDCYIGPDCLKSKGKITPFHVIWRTLAFKKRKGRPLWQRITI
jgi:hypothetical protein